MQKRRQLLCIVIACIVLLIGSAFFYSRLTLEDFVDLPKSSERKMLTVVCEEGYFIISDLSVTLRADSGYYHLLSLRSISQLDVIKSAIQVFHCSPPVVWIEFNYYYTAIQQSTQEGFGFPVMDFDTLDDLKENGILLRFHSNGVDAVAGEKKSSIAYKELNGYSTGSNPDIDDFAYSDLEGIDFWFGSGAGAWSTVVNIHADGTFNGYYHDSDTGAGDDYPDGIRYECFFNGKFSALKKVSKYEYSMILESLETEGILGEETIIDGVMLITSDPYGFDSAYDFSLYMPGKSVDELSEEFLSWAHGFWADGVLTCYGLYNVGGQQGFIVWPDLDFQMGF